jgi:hypothetical protein
LYVVNDLNPIFIINHQGIGLIRLILIIKKLAMIVNQHILIYNERGAIANLLLIN